MNIVLSFSAPMILGNTELLLILISKKKKKRKKKRIQSLTTFSFPLLESTSVKDKHLLGFSYLHSGVSAGIRDVER